MIAVEIPLWGFTVYSVVLAAFSYFIGRSSR